MSNNINLSFRPNWDSGYRPAPSRPNMQWGGSVQWAGTGLPNNFMSILQQLLSQLGRPNGRPDHHDGFKPNPNIKPTPKNNDPVGTNDRASTGHNEPVNISVLRNDTDADGDKLSIADFTQPKNGTVKQNGDQLVYTPKPGFAGNDRFQYTVSDGNGGTDTVVVDVAVKGKPNSAPQAKNDTATTPFGKSTTLDVVGNDTDADGDKLSITNFTQPKNGTVSQQDGKLVYTPKPGFSGTDSFQYTVSDGKGGTSTATATVTTEPKPNAAPVANKDSAVTEGGKPVSLSVLGNDTDADGDKLSITNFTQPKGGSVTQEGDRLVYTPSKGFSGRDTFQYTVSDGNGGTSTTTATVDVNPKHHGNLNIGNGSVSGWVDYTWR